MARPCGVRHTAVCETPVRSETSMPIDTRPQIKPYSGPSRSAGVMVYGPTPPIRRNPAHKTVKVSVHGNVEVELSIVRYLGSKHPLRRPLYPRRAVVSEHQCYSQSATVSPTGILSDQYDYRVTTNTV